MVQYVLLENEGSNKKKNVEATVMSKSTDTHNRLNACSLVSLDAHTHALHMTMVMSIYLSQSAIVNKREG